MSADLARLLLDSLDDQAIAELAQRLAPHLAATAPSSLTLSIEDAAATTSVSAKTIRRALTDAILSASQRAAA